MKLLPGTAPGGAIVKSTAKISADKVTPGKGKAFVIKRKLISIDNLLKSSLTEKKKEEKQKVRLLEKQRRDKKETKLETQTKEEKDTKKKLALPKLPFFERVKKFFLSILSGFVFVKLIDHADKILPMLPFIGKTLDTMVDLTIGFIDGLGGFLAGAYDLYDGTKDWISKKFGEDALARFDEFAKGFENLINAALLVAALQTKRKPDKPGRKPGRGPARPGGGTSKPPTAAQRVRNSRIRGIQRKFGPDARRIYENALNNGKTPSQAQAAVNKALRKGQITARPGASSLASRTAPKGSLFKGGLQKAPGRLGVKLFGKAGIKAVKGVFGRIPIMGPIIVAVASLLGGEPIGQALFKGVGAALGGLLGTFIPIPVIGTLLGETLGVFVGDLLYELILGKGLSGVGAKLKRAVKDAMLIGGAILEFFKEGFQRYINTMFEKEPLELPKGGLNLMRRGATLISEKLGLLDFLRDRGYMDGDMVSKFPNILNFFNPLVTVPAMAASFLPAIFGEGGTAFGGGRIDQSETEEGAGGPGVDGGQQAGKRSSFPGATSIGSGESGEVVKASHPEAGSGWTVKGQMDAQGRPIVLSKPGAEAFAKMMKDSGGKVKGSDVASSGRSRAKNESVGGHPNSSHMYGEGLDIHGTSSAWMKQNDMKYGWKWASGYTAHPGHFNFKIQSDTFNPNVMDKGGKIGKGMFMNKGRPEFVIDANSTRALEDNFPGFLAALNHADYNGAIGVLRNYASYEAAGGARFIPVPIPVKVPTETSNQMSSSINISGGAQSDPMMEKVYAGG